MLPEPWDFKRSLSKFRRSRIGLCDVSEIDRMGRKGNEEKIGEEYKGKKTSETNKRRNKHREV